MRKKRILICGATGFIGRNMAEFFAQDPDYEVYGTYWNSRPLINPRIRMIKADLTLKPDVDRLLEGVDILIQAAATTSGAKDIINKPYYHVTDNAIMNSLIFKAAFEKQVAHVIFFSCTVMYQSSERPVKETDFDANAPIFKSYFGVGWTKVYIEKMCEFYSRLGGTKFTVLRHSNIYGPYDKFDLERSHVFGATLTKVMLDQTGKIVVWGSGQTARDLLYVSDLNRCVEQVMTKQTTPFELYNVGSGLAIPIKSLVEKIIERSGRQLEIEFDLTKPDIKTALCLDTEKIQKAVGWRPLVSLDEGIDRTLAWYRENLEKGTIKV